MAHYTRGDVSCIEAMESAFGKEDVATFWRVNALKYVWRMSCHEDGAVSNAEKAIWYLEKHIALTIKETENGPAQ